MSASSGESKTAITGRAERFFMRGGCVAIAAYVHQVSGWPLCKVTDAHNVHAGRAGGGSAMHWVLETPEGEFADVRGIHTREEILEEYHGFADDHEAAIGCSSFEEARQEHRISCASEEMAFEEARRFAAAARERIDAERAKRLGRPGGSGSPSAGQVAAEDKKSKEKRQQEKEEAGRSFS